MRFDLISNSRDVIVGMRLAGIVGTLVRTPEEAKTAINASLQKEDVAILLINEGLADQIEDTIDELKNHCGTPLVVVIPDRKSSGRSHDYITKYIQEAIGLKIQEGPPKDNS